MHLGQVADVDGMGAALVFEDMEFSNSDRDYQDIVFQIGEPSGIVPRFVSLVRGDLPLLGTMLAGVRGRTKLKPRRSRNDTSKTGVFCP